jgi:hypothetical protein
MAESDASTATIEVNEAVFCSEHQKEIVSSELSVLSYFTCDLIPCSHSALTVRLMAGRWVLHQWHFLSPFSDAYVLLWQENDGFFGVEKCFPSHAPY